MKKIIAALVAALATLGSVAARSETTGKLRIVAPRIGAMVTLPTGYWQHGTFACYDQKAIVEAFAISEQNSFLGEYPDKVRGTPEAQKYLGIGCLPISRDDGPFEITAYDTYNCQIQSSSVKRPAWVQCYHLQTLTGEVVLGAPPP
jgi:hypothetical protein